MRKKKVLNIVSASAIAASALVVAAPAEAATVAQADKLVQTAKAAGNVLKWAISIEGTADGTTRPWVAYNNAKNAYDAAFKAVNTLTAAQKNKYLADLDANVKLHINRTMAYIDAITAGETIRVKQKALEDQLKANLINDTTEAAYHELSKEIRKQAILLDRVYGQSTRDLIRSQYKQTAEKVRDSAIYPVTVKAEIDLAQKAIAANDRVKAEKHMEEVRKYLKYVDNAVIKKSLSDRFSTVENSYGPKVEKVSAAEPKRIKIDFSKPMLSGYGTNGAENTANYSVSSRTIKSASLSDDKKSVFIELYESLYTNSSYTVTVKKNLQTANYETFNKEDYVSSFTFTKTTKPTVTFVTTDSNGNLEVKFSELIDAYSPLNITINGKNAIINSFYPDADTVLISKAELDRLGLQKGKYYSIVVTGARDVLVNYPNTMNTYSGTFFYNSLADTTLPEVRYIQTKGERTFTIEFSETLIDLTASHLVITKGSTSVRPTSVKDISGNKTKFEIELPTTVYATNESSVGLNVQLKDYKDLANNVGRTTNHYVNLTKDVTPLTFSSATFDRNANEFHIIFNKPLKAGTPVAKDNITAFDSSDKPFTPTLRANNGNKMIIDAKNLPDGDYIFIVADGTVKDDSTSQNLNKGFTASVTKKLDNVKPVATLLPSTVNGQFKVTFTKPVTDSALLPTNYSINIKGKVGPLPDGTNFTMSDDKKLVIITLPDNYIETSGNYTITVSGVEDSSRNVMNTVSTSIYIKENKQPVESTSTLHSNLIQLTFSDNISY